MKAFSPNPIRASATIEKQIAAFDQTLQAGLYEISRKNQTLHAIFATNQVALTAVAFDIGQSKIENSRELSAICQKAVDDLISARQLITELLAGTQASFASKIEHLKSIAVKKEERLCHLIEQQRSEDDQRAALAAKQLVQRAIEKAFEEEQRAEFAHSSYQLDEPLDGVNGNDKGDRSRSSKLREVDDGQKRYLYIDRSLSATLDLLNEISLDSPRDYEKRATR